MTASEATTAIERARALEAKATPGDYSVDFDDDYFIRSAYAGNFDESVGIYIAPKDKPAQRAADIETLVLARNAFPAFLDLSAAALALVCAGCGWPLKESTAPDGGTWAEQAGNCFCGPARAALAAVTEALGGEE